MKLIIYATVASVLLFQIVCLADLQFNISNSLIEQNKQWIRVIIGVQNGKQPLKYSYDNCPREWKQVYNYIYIPSSFMKSLYLQTYCRVQITDSVSSKVQGSINFIFNQSELSLQNKVYPYLLQQSSISINSIKNTLKQSAKISSEQEQSLFKQSFEKYSPTLTTQKTKKQESSSAIKSQINFANVDPKLLDAINKLRNKLKDSIQNQIKNLEKQTIKPPIPSKMEAINKIPTPSSVSTSISPSPSPSQSPSPSASTVLQDLQFLNKDLNDLSTAINSDQLPSLENIIKSIKESEVKSCDQKMALLSTILAKLENSILIKKEEQNKVIMEIKKAGAIVDTNNKVVEEKSKPITIVNNQIKQVKDKMSLLLPQLQSIISRVQNRQSIISKKRQQISNFKKEISETNIKNLQQMQQFSTIENNLKQIFQYEQFVGSQIQYFLDRKLYQERELPKIQQKLETLQKKTKQNRQKISILEQDSKRRMEITDILKNQLQALEITVQTEKTQITTVQKIKSEILMKLPELKKNKELEYRIMNSNQMDRIQRFLKAVKMELSDIESLVDIKHYICNFVREVTPFGNNLTEFIENLDPLQNQMIISYEIPVFEYEKYINNLYKIESKKSNELKVKMTPISILDSVWVLAFGYPYSPDSFEKISGLSFSEDFDCLQTENLKTWVGVILKIQPKMIIIKDSNDKKWNLHLSACSRIEAIKFRPMVGQGLRTRGVLRNDNNIEAYRCTCQLLK